ncbi:MAG: elongation factor G, partial [Spirochaetales bacterium]|nr:elongation factor G [Spirochaetales bacterium]
VIDTPGHVDFTIEVERSLRVLDGAILVLCSVGGVQSQSITVDRQMDRYKVPRIAFINKCDRTGANPYRVVNQMREKLHLNAVMVELPIGLEDRLEGVVDLINMKAIYFDEPNGTNLRIEEIPESMLEEAQQKREELIESASDFDDDLMNMILEGEEPSVEMIEAAIRRGTLSLKMCPVFVGSAHKNKGIQPLLDGVTKYLPEPRDVENRALDLDNNEQEVVLDADDKKTPVVLAFKLEDGRYGQLTYIRVYQGKLRKGDELINTRTGKRFRIGRLIKMHASEMEDITECGAGEIAALFGIDCASGDTFCGAGLRYAMTSMFVPNPVISLAIHPKDKKSQDNMSKAINRFMKEDPTFQCYVDPESNQTIIKGMGELHLDVYVERMRREYNCEVTVGAPEVAYREAISQRAEFNYTHKKQTGGSGQFARVAGYIEPIISDPGSDEEPKDFEFINEVKGGAIPTEYIPSCEKGFQTAMKKGPQLDFPIVGVRVCINDGAWHPVDSSDMAFQTAAIAAFKEAFLKAKPTILEPIMKVEIEGPSEFQGAIFGTVNQRRGMIVSSTEDNNVCTVDAEVPLAEMFGYSTVLRSMTQGKAEYTMEVCRYAKVPQSIGEELKKKKEEKDKAKK